MLNPTDVLQPFVGGGPYTSGTFKLYLNGDLTLGGSVVAGKGWDAIDLLKDGTCEKAVSATTSTPHSCPIIGSLTGGSGGRLDGVHFLNQDLLRCIPDAFAMNGTVESCDFSMFFEASKLNGGSTRASPATSRRSTF